MNPREYEITGELKKVKCPSCASLTYFDRPSWIEEWWFKITGRTTKARKDVVVSIYRGYLVYFILLAIIIAPLIIMPNLMEHRDATSDLSVATQITQKVRTPDYFGSALLFVCDVCSFGFLPFMIAGAIVASKRIKSGRRFEMALLVTFFIVMALGFATSISNFMKNKSRHSMIDPY